jgi:hypothetical protein
MIRPMYKVLSFLYTSKKELPQSFQLYFAMPVSRPEYDHDFLFTCRKELLKTSHVCTQMPQKHPHNRNGKDPSNQIDVQVDIYRCSTTNGKMDQINVQTDICHGSRDSMQQEDQIKLYGSCANQPNDDNFSNRFSLNRSTTLINRQD